MQQTILTALKSMSAIALIAPGIAMNPTAAGQAPPALTNVAWSTVVDTRENAFSVDVPQAWKTTGGMFRFLGVNPRPYIDMLSPDGRTEIRLGDPRIPNYTSPGPLHRPGPGVANYATGDVFATKYAQANFADRCQNFQLLKAGPMPPKYNQGGGPVRVTAGAAAFTCTLNGQPMTAYAYAETKLVGGALESTWYVVSLASFFAPSSEAQSVGQMMKQAGESIALNPQWLQAEGQRIREATALLLSIADQTRRNTQAMIEHQKKFNAMMRQEVDTAQDVILGVAYTRDPTTGATREVYNGAGYNKWTNGQNQVIDSTFKPGPSFHQLDPISR